MQNFAMQLQNSRSEARPSRRPEYQFLQSDCLSRTSAKGCVDSSRSDVKADANLRRYFKVANWIGEQVAVLVSMSDKMDPSWDGGNFGVWPEDCSTT